MIPPSKVNLLSLLLATSLATCVKAADAERSLELIELVTSERRAGKTVATTYSVYSRSGRIFTKRSVTEGVTSLGATELPGEASGSANIRLLLPGLSDRGAEFAARCSVQLALSDPDVRYVATGNRLAKALYVPFDSPLVRSQLRDLDLPETVTQKAWLDHVRSLGDLIAVIEFVPIDGQNRNSDEPSDPPESQ